MKIAIQGELGSFSHQAAIKLVPGATILPCALSPDVFAAVLSGEADAAVIPIENSLAGSVSEHFDLLLEHEVRVVDETLLRIHHNLIANAGTAIDQIERVFSHPVALAQCKRFVARHERMRAYAYYDTAGSVKQLVESKEPNAAAIASAAAAEAYGAQILAAHIEDNSENYTRFFLIYTTGKAEIPADPDKISLAFSVANRPGSLVTVLNELAALGVNMTKIESRPVQGKPWEYIFYVDCQVPSSAVADQAIVALHKHCGMVKELGRYRAGLREE